MSEATYEQGTPLSAVEQTIVDRFFGEDDEPDTGYVHTGFELGAL